MKSIMRWFASFSTSEGNSAEGCVPAFERLRTANNSEESVVTPSNIRNRDASVKIATRVPDGIVFRYLIICACT